MSAWIGCTLGKWQCVKLKWPLSLPQLPYDNRVSASLSSVLLRCYIPPYSAIACHCSPQVYTKMVSASSTAMTLVSLRQYLVACLAQTWTSIKKLLAFLLVLCVRPFSGEKIWALSWLLLPAPTGRLPFSHWQCHYCFDLNTFWFICLSSHVWGL